MKIKLPHAIALAIDEQERLLPAMQNGEETLRHTETLLKGLRLLDIPILITQQYTKGLGMSAPSLFEAAGTDSWLENGHSAVSEMRLSERRFRIPTKTGNRLRSRSAYLRRTDRT